MFGTYENLSHKMWRLQTFNKNIISYCNSLYVEHHGFTSYFWYKKLKCAYMTYLSSFQCFYFLCFVVMYCYVHLSNVLLFYYIEYVISCFIMFILIVLYVCLMLAVQSSSKCIIPKILKFSSMTYIIYSSCSKCLGISGLAESSILRFLGQSFYDSICFPEQQNLLYCVVVSRPR